MNLEELRDELDILFNPEPEEGFVPREFAHPQLKKRYGLYASYLETLAWEGSTIHEHTRLCPSDEESVHVLTRNMDVPVALFEAALRLFGDSLCVYSGEHERKGQLRFYPSVILTFWSGFEAFVRRVSQLLLATVPGVPVEIADYLQERDAFVDKHGNVRSRARFQAVLDRYAVFLRYGYSYEVDRGNDYWQRVQAAQRLRDYYTHLDVNEPRAVSSTETLTFMESVLLAIIRPSAEIRRTLLLGVYRLYDQLMRLEELTTEYVEQPFFKDWPFGEPYQFHCNFDGVDADRFPNPQEDLARREKKSDSHSEP